jgi:SAM-dependent methyltransferase
MPNKTKDINYSLDEPSELSLQEYQDLLAQIPSLTLEERQLELWDAARYNDLDVVRAILKTTQNNIINSKHSETGNTALHMASANGNVDIVKFLLHYNADAQIPNASGNTSLHWAASNGQDQVCKVLLERCKTMDVLQKNEFGRSALTEGFASGKEAVIQSLLEHESASEERLLSTSGGGTDGDSSEKQSVTHEMVFGSVHVKVRELSMAESFDDAILGSASDDTTGLGVWPASLVAAQWIARDEKIWNNSPGIVLELGAGCGVPSLVAAQMFQGQRTKVYATDWNAKSLDNLQFNATLNELEISVQCMDWTDKSTWPQEKIDLLIGSDLIYTSESVPLLVSTIKGLLSKSGRFLYTAPALLDRQGKDEFIQQMREYFDMTSKEAPPEYTSNPLASGDDEECFLHFNELQTAGYMLYEFVWKDKMDIDEP